MMDVVINLIVNLSWLGFLEMFWFLIIFEIPRYSLGVFLAGWRAVMEHRPEPVDPDTPVSVLLAGHNEASGLETSVRALREQTHRNLEIVVGDDGSIDGTVSVARDLLARGLIDAIANTELRGGKASILNLGLQRCSHEYVVVMDVDTSLDRDAISRVVAPMVEDSTVGAVSGNIGVRNPLQTPWTAFQAIEYIFNITLGRQVADLFGMLLIISGAFGAFRRPAVMGVGGWEVGPGEDGNLTQKMRRAGWRIAFEPDAWALTDVPATRAALYRQRMRWSRSLIGDRFRKFRSVFNPFYGDFRLSEVVALANDLFFHAVLTIGFFIYIGYILVSYPDAALVILVAVHLVYLVISLVEFLVMSTVVNRPGKWKLLPYLLGYSFYVSVFHRAVRGMAYFSELAFRSSYNDPFTPTKVRQQVERF